MKTAVLLLLATASCVLAQGPLTPPGAPAPTMKSLDQIEARTAIPKSPATPVSGPHYTISQPGSYYLTGNIEVASGNGINITASNVTLDLNGFAIISKTVSPAAGNAIDLAANLRSIEIKNGRITGGTIRTYTGPQPWQATFAKAGWAAGIWDVLASPAHGVLLSHLTVEQCGSQGIYLNGSSNLQYITVTGNGTHGIIAYQGCVSHAAASNNGSSGIVANYGSVTHATAFSNVGFGISASQASITSCTATSNGLSGIAAYQSSVTGCAATGNGSNGINASQASITSCAATGNVSTDLYANYAVIAFCKYATGNTTGSTLTGNLTP
jgi:hypothetical protein